MEHQDIDIQNGEKVQYMMHELRSSANKLLYRISSSCMKCWDLAVFSSLLVSSMYARSCEFSEKEEVYG